ncbi:MAG: sulfatase-like hydrolase/transferase [Kiritimatiellae bacterium]|nr:sulfatase-like hydrolase/transferase [Kiritimatiellia bacterium]
MPAPNVVLLLTDQQRFDTIHALGNSVIKTPNLDRLVAMGTGFTHAFTPQPVCGSARHSIFTGVDTKTVGSQKLDCAAWHPQGRFLPEVLAESGYRTGGFGKMHFKPLRAHHGFQHFALHEEMMAEWAQREDDDYCRYLKKNGYGHIRYPTGVRNLLYIQPQVSPIPEEHHETKWVADQAVEFIRTFHGHPFFLTASWMQPHWPTHVPKSWACLYRNEDIPMPAFSPDETLPWFVEQSRKASDLLDKTDKLNWNRILRVKALYYASISFIDHQIGRILDALEERRLLDNTLIIFTADHGDLLMDHLSFNKVCGYDPSIRVPFIAACPAVCGSDHVSSDFVTLYDVAPTIYEYTGVPSPCQNSMAGKSLLSGRSDLRQRERVFFEIGDGNHLSNFVGVRTRKWKYVFYHAGPLRQLFDLENDPHELHNLMLQPMAPEQKAVVQELHQSLLRWNMDHGLSSRVESGDFRCLERPPVPDDRNSQYDEWVDKLIPEENNELWSEARSVYEAIKDEPSLDPAELDLEYWEKQRGPGCIAELEQLMGRKLR